MKIVEYLDKNYPSINWNILSQLFEEEGVELTEEIREYLDETPWNTNRNMLKNFGIDPGKSSGDTSFPLIFEFSNPTSTGVDSFEMVTTMPFDVSEVIGDGRYHIDISFNNAASHSTAQAPQITDSGISFRWEDITVLVEGVEPYYHLLIEGNKVTLDCSCSADILVNLQEHVTSARVAIAQEAAGEDTK